MAPVNFSLQFNEAGIFTIYVIAMNEQMNKA